jgi:outer membrane receptor protein involved in Fe transport
MLEYVHSENHSFRLNVDNLTNKVYYSSLYQAWPSVAPLRTVRATWTGHF